MLISLFVVLLRCCCISRIFAINYIILIFVLQEVTAARHEMQRQTAEWYRGVREAPPSDKEEEIDDTDHSASSALLQNI